MFYDAIKTHYKILPRNSIKVIEVPPPLSNNELFVKNATIIDTIWNDSQKTKKLFNGIFLNYYKIEHQLEKVIVFGFFLEYKNLLAQRVQPDLGLGIQPIGVSGIILFHDADGKQAVFAKRSNDVLDYPGFFELAPSGSIDKEYVNNDGTIDYKFKLLSEFEEEIGLDKKCVIDIAEVAFILDVDHNLYDIGCIINITANKTQLITAFLNSSEYTSLTFIAIDKLAEFVSTHQNSIVPTSKALVEAFHLRYATNYSR